MQDENLSESLSQIWKSKSDETQRERDNAYIGQKMQFLSKNQAKVGKFIFNICCYRISNVFRSHKFHGGMHIWICWNLFQFMLSKLIQDWENLAFFSKHTQMRASPTFKSSQYVNRCIFVECLKWKINFVRPYLHANTNETVCRIPGVGGFSFIFHKVPD